MEFRRLQSYTTVIDCKSFTKAAEKLYISQPTISAHIHSLEEDLNTQLIIRNTKNIEVTPRGWELYKCALRILELRDNLILRWSDESKKFIHLGASSIPSAYILPEVLPAYEKEHGDICFIIQQGDSKGIIEEVLSGVVDIGLIGMDCEEETLVCIPFVRDHMVVITPVNEHFLALRKQTEMPIDMLLQEPFILREKGSGSLKSANRFLEYIGIAEEKLQIKARVNDQESIKNLVAAGLGISIVSEKSAHNFLKEGRLLQFELPGCAAERNLYQIFRKDHVLKESVQRFADYLRTYYCDQMRPK